jgi:hypothetical protein
MSSSQGLTIGELEANYSLYCKALRILLKEGKTLTAIQRTVAWSRLEQLHTCLPGRYKAPDYLCVVLKRDLGQQKVPTSDLPAAS